MDNRVSPGLRTTFLIHGIVGLIFGLGYLLIPETVGGILNMPMADPAYRIIGAAILGYTASSWLAFRRPEPMRVKIVVQTEIVWTVLGTVATIWAVLSGNLPAIGWLNAIILAAFGVAFGIFYPRE